MDRKRHDQEYALVAPGLYLLLWITDVIIVLTDHVLLLQTLNELLLQELVVIAPLTHNAYMVASVCILDICHD